MSVKLKLISDGDISGVIYAVDKNSSVDMYIGIGGGPEGVLAAAALSCYGGQIQTRLILNSAEIIRAKKMVVLGDTNQFGNVKTTNASTLTITATNKNNRSCTISITQTNKKPNVHSSC